MRGQILNGIQRMPEATSFFGGGLRIAICIFMMVFFLAITALVVIFIVKMLKSPNHMHTPMGYGVHPQATSSAIAILNERYAKGEITGEEYFKIKEDLLKQ